MFAAVVVAFIALFIPVTNHDPRFGLPVGGLFAAIANKYIIESLLPPTSEFTLADYYHSTSVIFILTILGYSALLLYLKENKKISDLKRFDRRAIWSISIVYIVVNVCLYLFGWD